MIFFAFKCPSEGYKKCQLHIITLWYYILHHPSWIIHASQANSCNKQTNAKNKQTHIDINKTIKDGDIAVIHLEQLVHLVEWQDLKIEKRNEQRNKI